MAPDPIIARVDLTALSRQSLGPLGRLQSWIERSPVVGRLYLRCAIAVVAVGAAASLLHAGGEVIVPETAKGAAEFVLGSWLYPAYGSTFAAVGFAFVAYSLIRAHNLLFQSNFSLRRNRLLTAIPRPWRERPVPHYRVPRAQIWRRLHALQRAAVRGAGGNFRRRIRRSRIALVAALACFAACFLQIELPVKSEEYRELLRAQPWIEFLFVPLLAGGFVGLAEFFRLRRPEAQSAAVRARAWRYRIAAVGLLLLPLLIRGLTGGVLLGGKGFDGLPEALQIIAGLTVLFGWIGGTGFLFHRAHVTMDAEVGDVRSSDARAPVVFFRSFADDGLLIPRAFESVPDDLGEPAVVARYLQSDALVNFEEVIERQVRDYAPLIAVGQPGVIRRGAAVREHFTDGAWRAEVLGWMDAAQFIVVIASWTPGLRWELIHIVARGHMSRLILVIPPGPHRAERWRFVTECFAGTPWFERLAAADHERVLALHWTGEGGAVFLCGDREGDRDYEIALHLAVYGLSGE